MNNLHRYSAAAALAFGVVVFSACAEEPQPGDELEMVEPGGERPSVDRDRADRPDDRDVVITSNFQPVQGAPTDRPIRGTAEVFEDDGDDDYRVSVRLEGLPAGEHAWHIHNAPCGKEGPVVVPFTPTEDHEGLARPLSPGDGGVAEAEVTVPGNLLPLDRLKSGEYSIHVHEKGGVEHGPSLACADL